MYCFSKGTCVNNRFKHYSRDQCIQTNYANKMIDLFGCTTPFGLKKDKICRDSINGSKVLKIHNDVFVKKSKPRKCTVVI